MKFTFNNLKEFATYLETLANEARQKGLAENTIKQARFYEGESAAYRDIAKMITDGSIELLSEKADVGKTVFVRNDPIK